MLIRSQDKAQLFNINHAKNISICEKGKGCAIYVDYLYCIGDYSFKEKALKVLDMIQDAYERYEYEKVFKTGLRLFEAFQMPEDDEVTEN